MMILLFGLLNQIMDHCQMKKVDTLRHYGCRAVVRRIWVYYLLMIHIFC